MGNAFALLPIIILAALRHPDQDLRLKLWQRIQDWVARSSPTWSNADIAKVLRQCKGTLLEPFHLEENDLQLATALAQVAFSSACNQTHFRIVSRETIGHSGGCVLSHDLSYYYVERFACGKITQISNAVWSFAPSEEPAAIFSSALPDATCHFGKTGFHFSAGKADISALGWLPAASGNSGAFKTSDLIRDLKLNSKIGDAVFDALNLEIHMDDLRLSFSTSAPETLMRMVAHFVDGAVIRIDPGPNYPERKALIYKPAALGESSAVKGCLILPGACGETWLNFPAKYIPEIDVSQMAAISRQFAIPEMDKNTISEVLA